MAIFWLHGTAHSRVHQYCNEHCNLTSSIFGATLCLSNQQTRTYNEVNLADEDVSNVTRFQETMAQVPKS